MTEGTLEKFHASGNEFLIKFWDEAHDGPLEQVPGSEWARGACDRDRGPGADGLIVAAVAAGGSLEAAEGGPETSSSSAEDHEVAAKMRLWNSDGSEAAVSGNCLRCLTHALARHWGREELDVWVGTSVGRRRCSVSHTDEPDEVLGLVGIGTPRRGPLPGPGTEDLAAMVTKVVGNGPVERWDTVDVGNHHAVFAVENPGAVPLDEAGPAVETRFPGGINVHFAALTGKDELTISIWERGAGPTAACGTGAVASAEVFRRWGLVGDRVRVRMPGGDAWAHFPEDASLPVELRGPSVYVETVDHKIASQIRGFSVASGG